MDYNVEDAQEILQAAATNYLGFDKSPTISAQDVYDLISDNDPFITSIRKPEHYQIGHIPGAYNIPCFNIDA